MGYIKYQKEGEQVSFGNGEWYFTGNKRTSDIVVGRYTSSNNCEGNFTPCNKLTANYNNGKVYEIEYDGNALHSSISADDDYSDIYPYFECSGFFTTEYLDGIYPISGLTSAVIGDCVTSLNSRVCYDAGATSFMSPFHYSRVKGSPSRTMNATSLTSLTIGDNVAYIGDYFFYGCTSLTELTLPNKLVQIGEEAFADCRSLSSITIPDNVKIIDDFAFYGCSGLTSLNIGSGIKSIGREAFGYCSGLTSVTINAINPPDLGLNPFNGVHLLRIYVPCESVDKYKALWWDVEDIIEGIPPCGEPPISVRFSANYQYGLSYSAECNSSTILTSGDTRPSGYEYSAMTSAVVGGCISEIGIRAFSGGTLSSVTIENGVTTIGQYAFQRCSGLTDVTIGGSVTTIGNYAFQNCSGITSITIPSSVTSIGNYAFSGCTSLSSLTIPNSVANINTSAFQSCSGLTSITINATTPMTLGSRAFNNTNDCPIYVPCESVGVYRAASGWNAYASRIQGVPPCADPIKFSATYSDSQTYSKNCNNTSMLSTGDTKQSGYEYSAMTSAIVGDCVVTIDSSAFTSCYSLSSVTIGSGVTNIYSYAFYECTSLSSFTIPSGVTTIPNNVFQGCTSLSSIIIPNNVTYIGQAAFQYCSGLTSVSIGSGVATIGHRAFYGCTNLQAIYSYATTPPALVYESVFDDTNDCPIYVPSQSVDAYKAASGWSEYANRIYPIS